MEILNDPYLGLFLLASTLIIGVSVVFALEAYDKIKQVIKNKKKGFV